MSVYSRLLYISFCVLPAHIFISFLFFLSHNLYIFTWQRWRYLHSHCSALSPSSLHSELNEVGDGAGNSELLHTPVKMVERGQETDTISLEHKGMVTSPSTPSAPPNQVMGRSQTKNEKRSANTLYQELSFQVCTLLCNTM